MRELPAPDAQNPAGDDLSGLRLDNRSALVTGAARGIGRAVAETLGRRGARVALFDRDEAALADAAAALAASGVVVAALVGDAADPADSAAAVDACVAKWGGLDILVNNAGVGGRSAPVTELTDDDWTRVVDINLNGVFYFCRAAARVMAERGYGRIVNVASIAGKEGNPNASHYSAAKAGVIALTKSLGKELATAGVIVTAIAPAVIETDILNEVGPDHVAYMKSKIPMERFGTTTEVARLVAFLSSDHVSFSTGAVYDVSGGRATY